jgi:hypothetical protein
LQQNPDKIEYYDLLLNTSLFTYDYEKLKERISIYKEELIQKVLHPNRLLKYLILYKYNIACEEYEE